MRKTLCSLAALAATAAAAPATATTPPSGSGSTTGASPARVTLESCRTGPDALSRFAVFTAQMTAAAVPGTTRMQLRFDLFQRLPGDRFRTVTAPGLGLWRSSTADVFRYRKQIAGLQAPAGYRAVVRFRWLGSTGVLQSARRTTPTCREPDPGADLAVRSIQVLPTADPARRRYDVDVRNEGRSDAGAFDAVLSIARVEQQPETVEGLRAGARVTISFVGPACRPGDAVGVQLDPSQTVDERDRANDRKVVQCPASTR